MYKHRTLTLDVILYPLLKQDDAYIMYTRWRLPQTRHVITFFRFRYHNTRVRVWPFRCTPRARLCSAANTEIITERGRGEGRDKKNVSDTKSIHVQHVNIYVPVHQDTGRAGGGNFYPVDAVGRVAPHGRCRVYLT